MRNKAQSSEHQSTKAPRMKKKTRHPHCALLRTWVPDRNHGCKALPPSRRNGRPLAVNLFSSRQALQTSHKYLQLWVLHNHIRFLFTMDIYRLYFTITTYKLAIHYIHHPSLCNSLRVHCASRFLRALCTHLKFSDAECLWFYKQCGLSLKFAFLPSQEKDRKSMKKLQMLLGFCPAVDFRVCRFLCRFLHLHVFRTSPFTFATCGTSPRRLGWRQRLARRERIKWIGLAGHMNQRAKRRYREDFRNTQRVYIATKDHVKFTGRALRLHFECISICWTLKHLINMQHLQNGSLRWNVLLAFRAF